MFNVLSLLNECSHKYSDKISLSYKDDTISFKRLNIIASKLGSLIKGNNKPIGVLVDRSINPILYFFSVLYSGNYYVPIDVDIKEDKLKSIIEETKFEYILGDKKYKSIIENLDHSHTYITLDDLDETKECCKIPEDVGDNDPAYMIYTSGSTGKPKGVIKSHKAIKSFIESYADTFDFKENDIIGNQTPFFFDASAKDLYLMLARGLTLDIIPSELFPMPTALIEHMNEKKISFISWVPTALSIVAQLNPFEYIKPQYLNKVFFVGEVMPIKHLNKWMENLPDIQYVNLYGQSELAGIGCYYIVNKQFDNDSNLPIGKPLSNCEVYLIDDNEIVKDKDHIGEIYIVSDALAKEYFNDKEKTNERFINKNFGKGDKRTFKTGDLAKYDEKGNLVFASRNDYQIKHMGYRIELGEIENIANSLDEISRCCCLYNNEKHKIVLFVQTNIEIDSKHILSLLRTKLSVYMIPNKVIVLESMPINSNGKIDRQRLREML